MICIHAVWLFLNKFISRSYEVIGESENRWKVGDFSNSRPRLHSKLITGSLRKQDVYIITTISNLNGALDFAPEMKGYRQSNGNSFPKGI